MELTLRIYLIFGISFCLAAPPKKVDSSSNCLNNSHLLSVQGDIFKNCHDFKKSNQNKNLYSTNAENNTLCILYYNSLSAYCQLNAKSAKYPALQDIQVNDIEVVCKNITPNLKTILKNSNLVSCYSLCSQLSGDIRPECLYAYYYNTSSNLNLPDTELPINEVTTNSSKSETKKNGPEKQVEDVIDVSNKIIIKSGNTPKESSNGTNTTIGLHLEGQENPPPVESPIESNSNTANRDHEEVLTNNSKSSNVIIHNEITDREESLHDIDNLPKSSVKDEKKVENPKNIAGHAEEPPITVPKATIDKKSQGIEEHQPVDPPTNNDEADKNKKLNKLDDKDDADAFLDNPSNNANNDDSEYNIDNNNAGDRTAQQDDANNGLEESVDTVAKLEDEKEIIDQKEEKKKPDFVQDSPADSDNIDEIDGESYFFSYFMVICVLFILGYVGYHNRIKVMALLLEGKRGKRQHRSRRPNSANYHKLDTNLEEAISSNVTKNSNNVIY